MFATLPLSLMFNNNTASFSMHGKNGYTTLGKSAMSPTRIGSTWRTREQQWDVYYFSKVLLNLFLHNSSTNESNLN